MLGLGVGGDDDADHFAVSCVDVDARLWVIHLRQDALRHLALAAVVGLAVNTEQQRGLNLYGITPSPALFSMGAPQALPNALNQRDGDGLPIASVELTLVDPAALQASDYELRNDTVNGGYLVTRLSDGLKRTVNSGDVLDGMRIDLPDPTPADTDRFLLQPVGRAASNMQSLLNDPRDLAAAAPLVGSAAPGNSGTASVATLSFSSGALPVPEATALRLLELLDPGR